MLWRGATETEPEEALPVEKLVPVHDVALVEDHESVEELPWVMDAGERERVQLGCTAQDALV